MNDSREVERSDAYWRAVDADYQAGMKLTDVYLKHDCTKPQFDRQRKLRGWKLRHHSPVNRERMVSRLLRLVLRHISQLELGSGGSEKDIVLLNQLVTMLGKLIRFEAATAPIGKRRKKTASLSGIGEKLVARIAELKRG